MACVMPGDRVAFGGSGVLEETDDVARAGEADADHARIARAIDHVVDQSGLEAAIGGDWFRGR